MLSENPRRYADAAIQGIRELLNLDSSELLPVDQISAVKMGTTVATNALIQRKGGKVALITTKGFRDLLEIGRQTRPHLYDFQSDHPEPLVPRERRFEIAERMTADGMALTQLSVEAVEAAEHTSTLNITYPRHHGVERERPLEVGNNVVAA